MLLLSGLRSKRGGKQFSGREFRSGYARREGAGPMVRSDLRPPLDSAQGRLFAKVREGWDTHLVDCANGRLGPTASGVHKFASSQCCGCIFA
jgi:hypothetical protein